MLPESIENKNKGRLKIFRRPFLFLFTQFASIWLWFLYGADGSRTP